MVASFILTTWLWLIIAVYHCQCSTEVEKEKHVHGQMRQQHHNQRRLSSFFGKNTTTSLRTPSAKPQAAPKYPGAIATLTSAVKSVMGTLKFGRQNTEEMSFSAQFNELQKLRPGEVLVIGCVGDSLTEGAAKDKRVSSYPTYLQEQLPLPAYKVFNFGKGSSTVLRTGVPFVNSTQYKLSMAAHLDVVVLMLGTNDARKIFWDESRFRRDYIDIIERYQALPSKPIVFVCTPPPVYCDPKKCFFDVQPEVVNEVLPFLIPEIAYYTGAFVIDNFAVFGGNKFSNPSSYYEPGHTDKADWDKQNHPPYDGVHLVAEGNKRLADSVSWRVVESLHKANKTYNLYLHHVVTRELKKIEAMIEKDAAQRKKVSHEDVYKHVAGTSLSPDGSDASSLTSSVGDSYSFSGQHGAVPLYPVFSGKDFIRPVIACVGDSITEGMGSSDDFLMSYPAILQRHPGFHHYQVLNLGVAGTCAMKESRSGSRPYWPTKQYELAMKSHPHIVVLQFGSNDANEDVWDEKQFVADYTEMIKKFQELPSRPSVYVGIPPPFNAPGKEEGFKRNVNAVLPDVIRGLVAQLGGVHLVDNFDALGGRELTRPQTFTSDHLHPNDVGYTAIAHQVASVISMNEGFLPISHKPPSAMRTPQEKEEEAKKQVKETTLAAQAAKSFAQNKAKTVVQTKKATD